MGMKTACLGAHSGSLKKTLVARTHNLGAPGTGAPVRQQPCTGFISIDLRYQIALSKFRKAICHFSQKSELSMSSILFAAKHI